MRLVFVDVDEGAQSVVEDVGFMPMPNKRLTWSRPAAHTGEVLPGEYITLTIAYEVTKYGLEATVHLRNAQLVSPLR